MRIDENHALKDLYRELNLCNRCRCGFCRRNCVTYRFLGAESLTCRGRNAIALSLLDGLIEASQGLAERFYLCTTCGFCKDRCPIELDTTRIVEMMRTELFKKGFVKPEHSAFIGHIQKVHNPYGQSHEEKLQWLPPKIGVAKKSDTAYFIGCTAAYRRPEIAEATVRVLNVAEVDFMLLHPEEWCCGSPALRIGRRDLFYELAKHNLEAIVKAGVTKVVTSCAGCYRSLGKDYKEFFGDLPFKVVHMSELIAELVKNGSLRLDKEIPKVVTYHDPCHLGRHMGIFEPPREVLRSIPAVKFVEMPRNRENALCCGAGGGVKAGFPDFARQAALERLMEAEKIGATTIVSACPFCAHNFKDVIREQKLPLEFYDLTEFILKSIR